ncbi:MAG TPA: hypothetical protein VGD68_02480 [Streptosporangiaceae bacterium]
MAAVVAAGSVAAVMITSRGGSPRTAGSPALAGAAARTAAVNWVVGQVDHKTVISCDPAICAALEGRGYPPGHLRALGEASGLAASGVVVVTPAARHLFGSSLVTAWAPAALAAFGSGNAAVSVRAVAPKGAAAYEKAVSEDLAERMAAEPALTRIPNITMSAQAARDLNAGRIDGRLMEAINNAAAVQSIDIVEFGNPGSGASVDVPLRYADLATASPVATMGAAAYVQALRAGMENGVGARPDRTQLVTAPGGQQVLRVEFLAPTPFGVLGSS